MFWLSCLCEQCSYIESGHSKLTRCMLNCFVQKYKDIFGSSILIWIFVSFYHQWCLWSSQNMLQYCKYDLNMIFAFYTPRNEVRGYIGFTLSVRLSVCLSVCPLTFRVRPVASTVQDGFFPYLVQMITSMRRCVACDDFWPISSRSFDLDLENRVRSVASTVLDGFLLYLAQMITIIRGCVAY